MKHIINRFKVKRLKKFEHTVSPHQFRLTLCDPNTEFLTHVAHEFAGYEQVEVIDRKRLQGSGLYKHIMPP